MYRIAKQFTFSASHQIKKLPATHKCSRLHGHNYGVEVILESGVLNDVGFIRDYAELDALQSYIKEKFDHRHLNDVLGDDFTSAEHLARHFYEWCRAQWPEVYAVRVSESAHSWAEYRG
jgi:6-pyruvoyltetrahydropterin/6-carboxytetrahydropterin synthase